MPKHLIIESSGGSAHITVAEARRKELLEAHNSNEDIAVIDILGSAPNACNQGNAWVPTIGIPNSPLQFFSGELNTRRWNDTQKKGGLSSVAQLEYYIDKQYIAEMIQGTKVYKKLKQFLLDNPDITEIYDTQPLSTPEICKAITEINAERKLKRIKENKKRAKSNQPPLDPTVPIKVTLMISEFVTEKTVHYLDPLRRVKPHHADCLTVNIVSPPLRPIGETEASFYKRTKLDHIRFCQAAPPLRDAFRNGLYGEKKTIYIKGTLDNDIKGNLKETTYLSNLLQLQADLSGGFEIKKGEQDHVVTLTLGSQGSMAILDYVDAFINQVLQNPPPENGRYFLFITTSKNDGSLSSFYANVRLHIEKRMLEFKKANIEFPSSAKIIPLSFQDDTHMSSLFQNSDVLVTRTGGMSSIETLETQQYNPNRKVYVHSEAKPQSEVLFPTQSFDACSKELLRGTIRWEGGNAEYLSYTIGACLTSTEVIRFIPNESDPFPNYLKSLTYLLNNDLLDEDHLDLIETYLSSGCSPHLLHWNKLPLIAFAKDIDTLKCLIAYGAQLSKETKAILLRNKVIDDTQLAELASFESKEKKARQYGVPSRIMTALMNGIKTGNTQQVKGLLYLYPTLANDAHKTLKELLDTHPIQEEMKTLVSLAQGYPKLFTELKNDNTSIDVKKYIIYQNRDQLNQIYKDQTALTVCQDMQLRNWMVFLGANPKYLDQSISVEERSVLQTLYDKQKVQTKELKKSLTRLYRSSQNEEDFRTSLETMFTSLNENLDFKTAVDSMIYELKQCKALKNEMTILEKFVDLIRYIFHRDFMTVKVAEQAEALNHLKITLN